MSLELFLSSLFGHVSTGFIEVRVIEEKTPANPKPSLVQRKFFVDRAELLADLPRLLRIAENRIAAIFFGVLPRREQEKGTSKDVTDGLVVWADLDFKDFPGGETEARQRLAALPLAPSILVRSGHGLHAYWLMREATDPTLLSRISKGIARAVGGDHTFDAARLLRLPGTFNRKDPAAPLPVEIETLDAELIYNPSEIEDALALVEPSLLALEAARTASREGAQPLGDADISELTLADGLSDRLKLLIETVPRVRNLFLGQGKPPMSRDGRSLDVSSSGYDFSLLLELIRRGVKDPNELGTTLLHRPDEAAKAKGPEYIARTVAEALKRCTAGTTEADGKEKTDPANAIDFVVEKVRIFDSDPARYEFTIDGQLMQLTSGQLLTQSSFVLRFLDAHKRVPGTPDEGWTDLVNSWLAGAETVEAPPEASIDLAVVEAVEEAIADLRLKEDGLDLHRGGACLLDDQTAIFRLGPMLKLLREEHPKITRAQLCLVLRDLGWQPETHKFGDRKVRGWVGPASTLDARARGPEECA